MDVQQWLAQVPAISVYVLVGVVVGVESLGIPLPGEIVLVAAALLSSQKGTVDPVVLGACASAGAVIGDSIGYAIGRRGGRPLLGWLGRTFPKHFSPGHVAAAERSFEKWGMWAVFFGRFVALLRIFAGPLAGVLRMPYWKFLTANLLGGVVWAGGTTAVIYYVGVVAEPWLKRFSYLGLAVAVLIGLGSLLVVRRKAKQAGAAVSAATAGDDPAGTPDHGPAAAGAAPAGEADRAAETVPGPGQGGTD
ncbi:DedA family protein [Streptomyces odontomachi]|uniref:DedA family protein n=1 Tax=Streptomyces odontomachi TaxID=2944940 RepID=UPI00210A3468|nr:DedA family protein [Streptomyces sp. ODS25]